MKRDLYTGAATLTAMDRTTVETLAGLAPSPNRTVYLNGAFACVSWGTCAFGSKIATEFERPAVFCGLTRVLYEPWDDRTRTAASSVPALFASDLPRPVCVASSTALLKMLRSVLDGTKVSTLRLRLIASRSNLTATYVPALFGETTEFFEKRAGRKPTPIVECPTRPPSVPFFLDGSLPFDLDVYNLALLEPAVRFVAHGRVNAPITIAHCAELSRIAPGGRGGIESRVHYLRLSCGARTSLVAGMGERRS
jgi:hypothetical protein